MMGKNVMFMIRKAFDDVTNEVRTLFAVLEQILSCTGED